MTERIPLDDKERQYVKKAMLYEGLEDTAFWGIIWALYVELPLRKFVDFVVGVVRHHDIPPIRALDATPYPPDNVWQGYSPIT